MLRGIEMMVFEKIRERIGVAVIEFGPVLSSPLCGDYRDEGQREKAAEVLLRLAREVVTAHDEAVQLGEPQLPRRDQVERVRGHLARMGNSVFMTPPLFDARENDEARDEISGILGLSCLPRRRPAASMTASW
jgi:hypothetical protein